MRVINTEIKLSSKDEIGTLAKSFNNMISKLRETPTSRDKLVQEINNRKAIESEKEKLEVRLHHAQKMEAIGQLTGGIAHDFNNMLAAIMGYTGLAQDDVRQYKNEKIDHYLNEVYKSSSRARDLVEQVQSYTRDTEENLEVHLVVPLIEESLRMLGSTLPSRIVIDFNADNESIEIMTNPVKFHQIIMNLCINAKDAMDGTGHIKIELKYKDLYNHECSSCHDVIPNGTRFIQLSIKDSGDGIEAELLERIFDPFFTTKEFSATKGTGLGLAVVHGIVHAHGGHIIVKSSTGIGTTFKILFPIIHE